MNRSILLNEASHVDEFSWESLIGGVKGDDCIGQFTCECYGPGACKEHTDMRPPKCTAYKQVASLIGKQHLPISIAELSY